MLIRAALETYLKRLAHGGTRAVASGDVRCFAGFLASIVTLQPRDHAIAGVLKTHQPCSPLDIDAGLGQALNQQTLMFVLRVDHGVRERTEVVADFADRNSRYRAARHPKIRREHLAAARDDRVSESSWLYSSSVRACTASARDVVPGSAVWSTILTLTPKCVSHKANTRPVGPAPTIRTSVF